ncbi:hypothetical protein CCD93_11465 [Vibrio sp. T21]|nr:hypothetical protein CCD93_11465 [Vibrio sp. T21]
MFIIFPLVSVTLLNTDSHFDDVANGFIFVTFTVLCGVHFRRNRNLTIWFVNKKRATLGCSFLSDSVFIFEV